MKASRSGNYFSSGDSTEKESEECIVVQYELKNINNYILKIEIPTFEEFEEEIDYGLKTTDNYEELLNGILSEFKILEEDEYTDDMNEYEISVVYKKLYDAILNNIEYDDYLK